LLVATEKPGHKVNAEKFEQMSINCVEDVEECHNIKVSNTFFVREKPKQIKTAIINKLRAD